MIVSTEEYQIAIKYSLMPKYDHNKSIKMSVNSGVNHKSNNNPAYLEQTHFMYKST